MAFNIPNNQKEVIDRTATDVQLSLPETNPFFKNSFLGALIYSLSGRIYDFYLQLNILIREMFPDTATNTFLERWGTYKGITRSAATKSSGPITVTGTTTSVIPIATQFSDANSNLFESTSSATIVNTSISISSLTRSGTTATATTVSNHAFGSTQIITIAGSDQSEYNGDKTITVTGLDTFTFQVTGSPTTPATGTITASADQVTINVESVDFGTTQNLSNGTQLTIGSPISGVDDTAIVQYAEVAGGTNLETDDDLRTRIIDVYQNPISHFNESDITSKAKELAGVTRVFIYGANEAFGNAISISSITRTGDIAFVTTGTAHGLENCMNVTISGSNETDYNGTHRVLVISDTEYAFVVLNDPTTPATGTITMTSSVPLGQTIVYFTRDNDDNIIPSNSEVDALQAQLFTIKPANTGDSDFIIRAPTGVSVDFTFTSLSPNTSTMQDAITANLTALFQESTTVGSDLKEFAYTSAIFQTVDPETGLAVSDFTLSSPSGSVTIAAGELPILGSITYP